MPNYNLTDKGMVTNDLVIMATVIGSRVLWTNNLMDGWADVVCCGMLIDEVRQTKGGKITIPYTALKSAIVPVEGEACVWNHPGHAGYEALVLLTRGQMEDEEEDKNDAFYNWCVINICQTYGDLRELQAATERWG